MEKSQQPHYVIKPETCKYSSILQGYNKWYIAKLNLKKETINPDEIKIKDELVLQGTTQAAADKIEYNTIGAFQTSDKNTHGYYIVKWIGNAYNLQEGYKCHAFNPPVIIPEGELVCPAKFMTPMKKTSHWYHEKNEATPVMVKLKQVVMHLIELIQENNTKNKLPLRNKGYADMNPCILSEHDHQVILEKIEARENLNHDEYVEEEYYYNVDSDEPDIDEN